jgi:hypothetical protein
MGKISGQNFWAKFLGKISGQNFWAKFLGKIFRLGQYQAGFAQNLSVMGKISGPGQPLLTDYSQLFGPDRRILIDWIQHRRQENRLSHDQIPKTDRYCSIHIISRF